MTEHNNLIKKLKNNSTYVTTYNSACPYCEKRTIVMILSKYQTLHTIQHFRRTGKPTWVEDIRCTACGYKYSRYVGYSSDNLY